MASIKEESTTIAVGDSAKLAAEKVAVIRDSSDADAEFVAEPAAAVGSPEDTLKQDLAEMQAKEAAAKAAKEAAAKENSGIRIHWIPLAIAGTVAVAGGVLAAVYNNKAKTERDKAPSNPEEYSDQHDKIQNNQNMRNISLGIAALGLIGVGVTFLF